MVQQHHGDRAASFNWLALAVDGPALELPSLAGGNGVRVVPDSSARRGGRFGILSPPREVDDKRAGNAPLG